MGNVSCRIVFDTSLFIRKIHVPTVSIACPYHILAVSGNHSLGLIFYLKSEIPRFFQMACGHGFCTATIPSMKKNLHLEVSIFSSEMKKLVKHLISVIR